MSVSADLVAFAAGGYAFRAAQRAAVRPVLLATLVAARAGAGATRTAMALAACATGPTRWRATVPGRMERLGPIDAALVAGVAVGPAATLATPVVCAALAAGESAGIPGAALLDAIVAGLEVALRVEAALTGHVERGWDPIGSCGRLGAALAASRAYGLSRDATRNAFGLAATAAGGLRAAAGTMTGDALAGFAAADGVEAALLARADFTAAPAALEGRRGLAALMADAFDGAAAVRELGTRFVLDRYAVDSASAPETLRIAMERLDRDITLDALVAAARAS